MRKILLLLFVFSIYCTTPVKAQQYMNFQGKIFQNGVAVNSNGNTMEFIISSISWSQLFNGNVNVHNGLYSVALTLPQNVFDSANTQRQMIVRFNSNYIDTITLYAPVERDPTVRSYIRDSVQWVNVHGKPTVDTSFTNELQTLSLNGDTLSITNGNNVVLPHESDTLHNLTINGNFTVLDTSISVMTAMPFLGNVVTGTIYWQSFKATANGKLRQLKISVAASATPANITVTIYNGIGNTTSAIAYKNFTVSGSQAIQVLDLSVMSGGSSYVSLSNGQIYTFEIKPATSGTVSVLTNPGNPYPDGISSINATTDIPFELNMDNSAPPCLSFDNNCRVGIGTSTPTAQLEVKGRIKDQTGFLTPVGTVIAYAGRAIPEGWLLCDGRPVSRSTYADLFVAIDSSWGAGNSSATFNLPDLRGQFLRGVDTSANVGSLNADPDHSSRTASNFGGNTGNKVGSMQNDLLRSHTHPSFGPYINISTSTGANHYSIFNSYTNVTGATGGSETRPKNAYVYYIIKY